MTARVDRRQKVFDLFFLESFQTFKTLFGESVEIGKRTHAAFFMQKGERRLGHPLYVCRIFRTVMRKFLHDARRTGAIRAEQIRPDLFDGRTAGRAEARFLHRNASLGMRNGAENFGNDLVGAANKHARADFDILARQIAEVVERSAAHRGTSKLHGRNERKRREFTRSSDLPDDFFNGRLRFFRFKLIGDRPARELIGITHETAHSL